MRKTWEGMQEAVAIADAGTFAGAATLLSVSTSHISKVIARLEHRIGAEIFRRTTRRVELTDTGRAFVEQSRRLIEERDEFLSMVGGAAEPQGNLRITCSTALGERFLAPIVRRFCVENARLSVTLDLTNRVVDLVGEGYDLAVRTGEVSDPRLVRREIAMRPIETCASPEYLDIHGSPQTIDELGAHACLIGTTGTWHFQRRGVPQIIAPTGRWRCNSGDAVVDAALAGMGICHLPLFYMQDHIAAGRLLPILTRFRAVPEPIWAVYPAKRHIAPKVRNLVDLLEQSLAKAIDLCHR